MEYVYKELYKDLIVGGTVVIVVGLVIIGVIILLADPQYFVYKIAVMYFVGIMVLLFLIIPLYIKKLKSMARKKIKKNEK